MKKSIVLGLAIVLIVLVGAFYFKDSSQTSQISPSDYSTNITNPHFTLPIGKIFVYESDTEDGLERIEIEIENRTRKILGVETIIYRDKEYLDGELIEDTEDYLAQDKEGNVWYFGEKVDNYEDGKVVDNSGSWIAGEDGALPGIWIKANHIAGDSYRQEYYEGVAEDTRNVVEIGIGVETSYGSFDDCIKFYDWTPLDPAAKENKYYCSEVSALVLVEDIETGQRTELVDIISPDAADI